MQAPKIKIETQKMQWCAMTLYQAMNSTKKEDKKATTRRERKSRDNLTKYIEKYCHLEEEKQQKVLIRDLLKKLNKYKVIEAEEGEKNDKKKSKKKGKKRQDPAELKELCELINLVLLRPDFDHGLSIRKQTPMQKLFTIWMKAKGEKRQVVGQLLGAYIASYHNLTAISSASASAHYQLMLYMLISYSIAWKMRSKGGLLHDICLVPLLQMSLFASSVMVGTYAMRYLQYKLSSWDRSNQLDVDARLLVGSYTRHPSVLQYRNSLGVAEQISKIRVAESEGPQEDVKALFLRCHNLLHKYAACKRSPEKGWMNWWFMRSNLQEISQEYASERGKLRAALKENSVTNPLKDIQQQELSKAVRKIFTARNFNALKGSVQEEKDHQEEIIALYEMIDKGLISVDIESAYIVHELVQSVIFSGYRSPLEQRGRANKDNVDNQVFEEFLTSFHQIYKDEKIDNIQQIQRVMISSVWKENQKLCFGEIVPSNLFEPSPIYKDKAKQNRTAGEYGSFVNIVDACMAYMNNNPKLLGSIKDQADIIGVLLIASLTYVAASSMLRLPFLVSVCYLCFKPQIDNAAREGIELCENVKSGFDNAVNVLYNAPQYVEKVGNSIKHRVIGVRAA